MCGPGLCRVPGRPWLEHRDPGRDAAAWAGPRQARAVGRPLLLLDVVPEHGRDNLQHELELGDASVTSARAADVVRNTLAALDRIKPPSAAPRGAEYSEAGWETSFTAVLERIGRGLKVLPEQPGQVAAESVRAGELQG